MLRIWSIVPFLGEVVKDHILREGELHLHSSHTAEKFDIHPPLTCVILRSELIIGDRRRHLFKLSWPLILTLEIIMTLKTTINH